MRDFSSPRFQSFSGVQISARNRASQTREQFDDKKQLRLAWEEQERLRAPFRAAFKFLSNAWQKLRAAGALRQQSN